MIIDSHGHLVPPALLHTMKANQAKFPSVRMIEEGASLAFSFAGNKPTRPVSKPLTDIAARIAWMDQNKIDRQVVGGWVDSFGYEIPGEEGVAWSAMINEALLAASSEHKRFVPLATVPMQDGAKAAQVLKKAMADGFPGVMIGTLPRGVGSVLDIEDLEPFWKAADETGAAIHIHPSFDAGDHRVHDYGMANGVGRITDAMVAVSRLVYSGHLVKYKNAKVVVGMGGAGLPFIIGRLRRNAAITPNLGDPDEALRHLYVDTILHDARVLRFVAEIVGADRIMMGTDMPFPIGDDKPLELVKAAGFGESEAKSINGGLAAKIFRVQEVV
ncbi:MAG: amidohydrolase family protein [Xanthobacteraceae bacterium]|nr:amidohydrolase family protein [Xanthobacteraceae bacterium]MCW5674507.1 amidohydrolase family protein [Xanthobacteraceae bacterium]